MKDNNSKVKKKSKFDYDTFYAPYDGSAIIAISKQRHSFEGALKIAWQELSEFPEQIMLVKIWDSYVWYGFGYDCGERINTWWLDNCRSKRSCPVWAFSEAKPDEYRYNHYYQYLALSIDGIVCCNTCKYCWFKDDSKYFCCDNPNSSFFRCLINIGDQRGCPSWKLKS